MFSKENNFRLRLVARWVSRRLWCRHIGRARARSGGFLGASPAAALAAFHAKGLTDFDPHRVGDGLNAPGGFSMGSQSVTPV